MNSMLKFRQLTMQTRNETFWEWAETELRQREFRSSWASSRGSWPGSRPSISGSPSSRRRPSEPLRWSDYARIGPTATAPGCSSRQTNTNLTPPCTSWTSVYSVRTVASWKSRWLVDWCYGGLGFLMPRSSQHNSLTILPLSGAFAIRIYLCQARQLVRHLYEAPCDRDRCAGHTRSRRVSRVRCFQRTLLSPSRPSTILRAPLSDHQPLSAYLSVDMLPTVTP